MNDLEKLTSKRLPKRTAEPEIEWMHFDAAVREIASKLALPQEVAIALMLGLCAMGLVRRASEKGIIDPDEEPMRPFCPYPLLVSEDDFRDWLRDHCLVAIEPEREIMRKLRACDRPGENISWNDFCDEVREQCGGWLKRKRGKAPARKTPAFGFGDKQIQRIVRKLRQQDI